MTEVSVVIPAYNAEVTLRATVESVLKQTTSDLEVLIIDDGSTDATPEIARSFGGVVKSVTIPNSGVAVARNTGLAMAQGRYVALLDADDLWEPEKLERQVELLNGHPEVGACFTAARGVDGSLRHIDYKPARQFADLCAALLLYSVVLPGSCSSGMIRREIREVVGDFDPRFSQCADWNYWLRLSQVTRIEVIDEPLVLYRISGLSMSSDIALLERDTFAVLDDFYAGDVPARYRRIVKRVYSNHWLILSGSYLHVHQPRDSIRCLTRGLLLAPANVARPLGLPARRLRRRLSISPPGR